MFILYCQLSDYTNRFVHVELDLLSSSVHCMFEQQTLTSNEKSCSIVYGPGEQCKNLSLSSRSESSITNSVIIDYQLFPSPQNESVYCYVLTAFDGTFSASIEGTFSTGINCSALPNRKILYIVHTINIESVLYLFIIPNSVHMHGCLTLFFLYRV